MGSARNGIPAAGQVPAYLLGAAGREASIVHGAVHTRLLCFPMRFTNTRSLPHRLSTASRSSVLGVT